MRPHGTPKAGTDIGRLGGHGGGGVCMRTHRTRKAGTDIGR